MATTIKNQAGAVNLLTRGRPANLGTVGALGDVVAFTFTEPTDDYRGQLNIQAVGTFVGTISAEFSIDGGVSWSALALTAAGATAFTDTAASGFSANVSGLGSGAQVRVGFSAFTSGSAAIWALVG